jgi:DNA ligase-1
MNKQFKPMLAPNQAVDLKDIQYPQFASYKLDGIRCIIHPELGIVSRSLKQIPNKQIQDKYADLLAWCRETDIILDGELYGHGLSFQEITGLVITKDHEDPKTIKKYGERTLPDELKYHCFDAIPINDMVLDFSDRIVLLEEIEDYIPNPRTVEIVIQQTVYNAEDVKTAFEWAIKHGYEGLMLKSLTGLYKFGRGTLKEGIIYKVKPYIDKSAIIKGFVQATVVDPNAEKTVNELGNSVTSKKKDDRILIDKLAAFVVDYEGQDLKVVVAATDKEKEQMWSEREKYLGCELNYKSMEVGQKDGGLPRHPVMTRVWLQDE